MSKHKNAIETETAAAAAAIETATNETVNNETTNETVTIEPAAVVEPAERVLSPLEQFLMGIVKNMIVPPIDYTAAIAEKYALIKNLELQLTDAKTAYKKLLTDEIANVTSVNNSRMNVMNYLTTSGGNMEMFNSLGLDLNPIPEPKRETITIGTETFKTGTGAAGTAERAATKHGSKTNMIITINGEMPNDSYDTDSAVFINTSSNCTYTDIVNNIDKKPGSGRGGALLLGDVYNAVGGQEKYLAGNCEFTITQKDGKQKTYRITKPEPKPETQKPADAPTIDAAAIAKNTETDARNNPEILDVNTPEKAAAAAAANNETAA